MSSSLHMKGGLALLSIMLLLTAGCARQSMNDSLNQYIDETGRTWLNQAGSRAVCCVVGDGEELYWKHAGGTVFDIYGKSLPWSSGYWKSNSQKHWLQCEQSPEMSEQRVRQNMGRHAYVLYCKQKDTPLDRGYSFVDKANYKLKKYIKAKTVEQSRVEDSQEKARLVLVKQQRESTCKSFGFKETTESFRECMFELYKLEQQALVNAKTLEQNRVTQASNAAAQQQMLKQQRFELGMQQLQNAANILNPPKTTCKWNALTSTMVCQ